MALVRRPEARAVKPEAGGEVGLQGGSGRGPHTHRTPSLELVAGMPDRLAEAPAAAGEEALPGAVSEAQDRVAGPPHDATAELLGPGRIAPEPLTDEQVVRAGGERRGEGLRRRLGVVFTADRTEAVTVSVADQSQQPDRPNRPLVERDDCPRLPVRPAQHADPQSALAAVVSPPQLAPLPGGEDVPARSSQAAPLVADQLERADDIKCRCTVASGG